MTTDDARAQKLRCQALIANFVQDELTALEIRTGCKVDKCYIDLNRGLLCSGDDDPLNVERVTVELKI